MARARRRRKVCGRFSTTFFKPAGVPKHDLEEVVLTIDEIEAIRLADYEGMYQADASEKMGISRQTLGNILKSARLKIADALIHGKSIKLEGGIVEFQKRMFACQSCGHKFENEDYPSECPDCSGTNVKPTED